MPSSPDAVAYIYENVGVATGLSKSDGVSYIYENVGVAPGMVGDAVVYIYEYVDATAVPAPRLWMLTPTSGDGGTTLEIWGHGWAGDEIRFFLGAQPGWDGAEEIEVEFEIEQVTPAAFVAATGDAYGALRSIPVADDPNVEHWKATLQIPMDAPSGIRKIRIQTTDNP